MKLFELTSPQEVQELHRQLNKMFYPLGIQVILHPHLPVRLLKREKSVTLDQLLDTFARLKQRHKKKLLKAKKGGSVNGIIKDTTHKLNLPFNLTGNEMKIITAKTKEPSEFVSNRMGGEEFIV